MIAFIKGSVYSFGTDWVIVENNGIGYYINFMHQSELTLGGQVTIFTYQHFREDATVLYGFISQKELDLFTSLISVKGLGPKTAMTILGHASVSAVIEAIENGDLPFLKRMPGVGAKTAQQIILDLKGKLVEDDNSTSGKKDNPELSEAISALKSLGYKPSDLNPIMKQLREMEKTDINGYVKAGLKLLAKRKGI